MVRFVSFLHFPDYYLYKIHVQQVEPCHIIMNSSGTHTLKFRFMRSSELSEVENSQCIDFLDLKKITYKVLEWKPLKKYSHNT